MRWRKGSGGNECRCLAKAGCAAKGRGERKVGAGGDRRSHGTIRAHVEAAHTHLQLLKFFLNSRLHSAMAALSQAMLASTSASSLAAPRPTTARNSSLRATSSAPAAQLVACKALGASSCTAFAGDCAASIKAGLVGVPRRSSAAMAFRPRAQQQGGISFWDAVWGILIESLHFELRCEGLFGKWSWDLQGLLNVLILWEVEVLVVRLWVVVCFLLLALTGLSLNSGWVVMWASRGHWLQLTLGIRESSAFIVCARVL